MDNIWPIAVPIVVVIYLLLKIKLIPENSIYAVIKLGKHAGFKGPGLHFKWSGNETVWFKLTTGDRGNSVSQGIVKFQNIDLPVITKNKFQVGEFVKITGFTNEGIEVDRDQDQSRSIICEKCGHENIIT